ncbi:hypothetical protein BBP40_009990 [Aspergillus hancockii]|nr:hypothetical protein BBP40_009990 [Aspergillus hancockii]
MHPAHPNTVDGSSLLFNQVKPIETLELLVTLPPQSEVDELICQFFDNRSFPITVPRKSRKAVPRLDRKLIQFTAILHEPTFRSEYNRHWADPSQTNVIWLGLLFSMLGIVMLSYHQYGEPPKYEGISESLFHLYRLRTAQCLMMGDIAKCLPYTIETLRFNATAELNRKDDSSRGLWIMTGVVIRAAINMGYHRELLPSASVSVLQAEYRRRVWLSVICMDNMASFMGGFPRMLPATYADMIEPRNLHDYELSDGTTVLPLSRPLSELTPVTYLIVKSRLFRALGRVTDLSCNPIPTSYDIVLQVDKSLYEASQGIPTHMQVYGGIRGFSNLSLQSMYHHGMCVLHRRFIARSRSDPRYNRSRSRCISSALALINLQHILEPTWYSLSLTRKMLILAAMLLFLELEHRRQDRDIETSSDSRSLLQALEKSCALWGNAISSCDEAKNIAHMLTCMLSSLRTAAGALSSNASSKELLSGSLRLSPQIQHLYNSLSLDKELFTTPNDVDIEWSTWDAFIEQDDWQDEDGDTV